MLRWRKLGFITGEKRLHGRRPYIEFDLEGVMAELERFKVLADDLSEGFLKGKIRDQIEEAVVDVKYSHPPVVKDLEPKKESPKPPSKPDRPLTPEEEVWGRKGG